ncbi:Gfo/Idh/MocA family protein [Gloeocapsa sp. PCC 73106]|uniref:Gfo/Idh/MocA family protein n=1 Tax=Gloeocapsa sp. PCC 73106 TaxID=102232 RepID=UPI0002ACC7EE|nr:Gfo/Idh/MocA family oxidoreductase [Gloeocapsa sp. PCC 73106]ELS00099.1 putative dehydrogenase [Gloeocapsa sp. PCC 73106]
MRIAFVGCGFVADYYINTLSEYKQLELAGVTDKNPERTTKFSKYYGVRAYDSLEDLLEDDSVDIVLNLTNPRSHYTVSKACLEAGKHVYSEKPLGMTNEEAKELVAIATSKDLQISSAPCNVLGETAQTLWKALRENVVGKVRLVYAEMDDAMVHQMPYKQWLSKSGTQWPHKDEFEVGCTLEHAGYYLTWLTTFFGPAATVTAFSSCLIPDKVNDVVLDPPNQPDFSVACIKFASGVVARLTCSIVAPHDHSLKIIGDQGILSIKDCWYYDDPVYIQRMLRIRRKVFLNPWKQKYPLVRKSPKLQSGGAQRMDFCRGVVEMAESISQKRPNRLSRDFSLHNNELVNAITSSLETGSAYQLTTSFEPISPMDWAR